VCDVPQIRNVALQSINQSKFTTRAASSTELESEARAVTGGRVLRNGLQ